MHKELLTEYLLGHMIKFNLGSLMGLFPDAGFLADLGLLRISPRDYEPLLPKDGSFRQKSRLSPFLYRLPVN
ncbi:hypothetical protein PDUR_05980 [Paenibacillus durus]|uniref:Uncharacterized protein n=1 Tax=Paenibacillus durus TaxID=44251 RepID=A0A089HLG8_PAEDU|nr:hypothetical protein PDUR_05980 [Paenibacillus durus]